MGKNKEKTIKIPNPFILLFGFLVAAAILTWIIPSGSYERVAVEGLFRPVIVPGTYQQIANKSASFLDIFMAIPKGMVDSASIIFLIFVSTGTFKVITKTGAFEAGIGTMLKNINKSKIPELIILWLMTFLFSILGFISGPDALIPFTLIAVSIALGLGYDLIVGLALILAGAGIGFAFSPINAAVVGTPQSIVGLPIFSGMEFRTIMWFFGTCVVATFISLYGRKIKKNPKLSSVYNVDKTGLGLSKAVEEYKITGRQIAVLLVFVGTSVATVYGSFNFGWYLNEIAGIFLLGGILAGVVYKLSKEDIINGFIEGGASTASVMLLVGLARAIQVILEQTNVLDTIIYWLSGPLSSLPTSLAAVGITGITGIMHIFITSGSGLSVALMPIIGPVGSLAGLTMQSTVLAFQVGGSLANMILPTLGSTMAMCGLARVPFNSWFKVGWKMVLALLVLSLIFILISIQINYGPM